MKPGRVLVVGSANTDMSVRVGRLPKPGETILGGEFSSMLGGKGANQAVAAVRAGGDVTFIARIGRDPLGDRMVDGLAADGVNIDYIVRDPLNPSGVALICIDCAGENSIAVAPGSNAKLSPANLQKAREAFDGGVVLLQLEIPVDTVNAAVEMAAAAGLPVILNPAPAQRIPAGLLRHLFVLTPNENETELLTGIKLTDNAAIIRAADELLARGPKNVIITLGSGGLYVAGKAGLHWIPAHKVKAVDTTAAGDVFNGVLAVALAEGKTLVEAAGLANAAAAISVTRPGAQTSAPNRAEIDQMRALSALSPDLKHNGHSPSRSVEAECSD